MRFPPSERHLYGIKVLVGHLGGGVRPDLVGHGGNLIAHGHLGPAVHPPQVDTVVGLSPEVIIQPKIVRGIRPGPGHTFAIRVLERIGHEEILGDVFAGFDARNHPHRIRASSRHLQGECAGIAIRARHSDGAGLKLAGRARATGGVEQLTDPDLDVGQRRRAVVVDFDSQVGRGRTLARRGLDIGVHHEIVGGDHFHAERSVGSVPLESVQAAHGEQQSDEKRHPPGIWPGMDMVEHGESGEVHGMIVTFGMQKSGKTKVQGTLSGEYSCLVNQGMSIFKILEYSTHASLCRQGPFGCRKCPNGGRFLFSGAGSARHEMPAAGQNQSCGT